MPTPRICVSQKDPEILRKLAMRFGGRVYSLSMSRGRTERMHQWYLTGRVAIGFLFTIFPFLSQRRRAQAHRVIAAWKTRPAHLDLPATS